MNIIVTVLVVLACSALGLGLSRLLLQGEEGRTKRLAVNALCLLFGVVLAVLALKYAAPLLRGAGTDAPLSAQSPDARAHDAVNDYWARHRFFALLEEASPEAAGRVRARMTDMAKEALRSGGRIGLDEMARIGATSAHAAMALIARASDESVTAFAKASVEQMNALRERDPKFCLLYLFPDAFAGEQVPPDLAKMENERILDALAVMLDSALHAPQEPHSREESGEILARALNALLPRLEQRHGGREPVVAAFAAMANPRLLPKADPAVVADVAISFYQELLALPPAERGPALRMLFAGPEAARK